ncbi:hypothetical protein TRFO_10938 [Tritrichomonas foetus]|uniref:Transmembrane protein n=1 Tax=Tritrichomonas foetus TaxID=1144522 RepID=A0A1J4JAT1_9EUKA|nr:hypothetical protein TRFO_10938 [Tritrichomonas foetus]|eukprot:OHS94763.1 hypothetical protein TRFO_10938 [Tritrichomonas foetus]
MWPAKNLFNLLNGSRFEKVTSLSSFFIFTKMDGNTIMKIWLFLHGATVISVLSSFLLSFKNPYSVRQPLIICTILHAFIAYLNLKAPSRINQKFTNRVLLDYSVHIIFANFLFYNALSFSWPLVLGFSSLYQLLNYANSAIFPHHQGNWIIQKLTLLYQKLTNPPLANFILSTLEIMCLMPPPLAKSRLIISLSYFVSYILYRYAVDNTHKLIWSQLRTQIATLAYKLPTFLCNMIMNLLGSFEKVGAIGCKIYAVKVN